MTCLGPCSLYLLWYVHAQVNQSAKRKASLQGRKNKCEPLLTGVGGTDRVFWGSRNQNTAFEEFWKASKILPVFIQKA